MKNLLFPVIIEVLTQTGKFQPLFSCYEIFNDSKSLFSFPLSKIVGGFYFLWKINEQKVTDCGLPKKTKAYIGKNTRKKCSISYILRTLNENEQN